MVSDNEVLLDTHQAAAMLGLKDNTLRQWRLLRIGPPWVVFDDGPRLHTVRYRRTALWAYVLLRERQTTRLPALSYGRFPTLESPTRRQERRRASYQKEYLQQKEYRRRQKERRAAAAATAT